MALLRCVPSRWELRLNCRLGTFVRVPPARVISRVGPVRRWELRLDCRRFRCRVLSRVQTLAVGALLNSPRRVAFGGSPARLSPRSCVVWPWRWELCSIVASVLCRVGPWRWELCSIVALVDLVVIPTRIDACSRLDQKIFRRLSEQLLESLRQLLGGKMAISMTAPVAEAQVAAKVGELSPELQFLLDGADVSSGIQAKISECGILSVDVFAKIEDDIAGFRAFVKRDLTMDPAVSTQNRMATAKLINAWETAQVRGKKRREEEAELRVGDLP